MYMRHLLLTMACVAVLSILSGCSDSFDSSSGPGVDSGVPSSAATPMPQQDTYEPPQPSREVDSNGNCVNQSTC
jgi:hypothetical protein